MRTIPPTLALLGILGLACGGMTKGTDDFRAELSGPTTVPVGQAFEIQVTVVNTASTPQELTSLDFADAWLKGVAITGSSPAYTTSDHVPIDDTTSYTYGQPIPAGGQLTVTLQAVATLPGTWQGEVDVCVGGIARFNSYPLLTIVQ